LLETIPLLALAIIGPGYVITRRKCNSSAYLRLTSPLGSSLRNVAEGLRAESAIGPLSAAGYEITEIWTKALRTLEMLLPWVTDGHVRLSTNDSADR
jgi:hypothetical protein